MSLPLVSLITPDLRRAASACAAKGWHLLQSRTTLDEDTLAVEGDLDSGAASLRPPTATLLDLALAFARPAEAGDAAAHPTIPDRDAATLEARVAQTRAVLTAGSTRSVRGAVVVGLDTTVRVDLLVKRGESWRLIVVTPGTSIGPAQLARAAWQFAAARMAGLNVTEVTGLAVNREYVHPGGTPAPQEYLTATDLLEGVATLAMELPAVVEAQRASFAHPTAPAGTPGKHCGGTSPCPAVRDCPALLALDVWPAGIPRTPAAPGAGSAAAERYPVSELPSLSPKAKTALAAARIRDIRDIPPDFSAISERQAWIASVVRSGRPALDATGLLRDLSAIPGRWASFDIETLSMGLPPYAGLRPYEVIPAQWALTRRSGAGVAETQHFLFSGDEDPRRAFAVTFLDATEEPGPLLVYHSYERQQLTALAERLPDLADALLARVNRLVDVLKLLRKYFYDPRQHGSYTLKTVLPLVCPELGYGDLAVQSGDVAALLLAELTTPGLAATRRAEIRDALLRYCGRDAEGLLVVAERLTGVVPDVPTPDATSLGALSPGALLPSAPLPDATSASAGSPTRSAGPTGGAASIVRPPTGGVARVRAGA